jgi:ParB family chromosome partitioning protein
MLYFATHKKSCEALIIYVKPLYYHLLALRLGKAVSTVNNITRLLQLPEPAQAALRANQISEGHARAILALKEYTQAQDFLLVSILKLGWTVRQAEQYVTATKNGAKTVTDAKKAAIDTTPQTKHLSKKLGTKVTIKRTAKGGSLQIYFRSEDELNTIFKNL